MVLNTPRQQFDALSITIDGSSTVHSITLKKMSDCYAESKQFFPVRFGDEFIFNDFSAFNQC